MMIFNTSPGTSQTYKPIAIKAMHLDKALALALVALGFLIVSPLVAEEEEAAKAEPTAEQVKAKKILKAANDASQKVNAVRFNGSVKPTGMAVNFVTPAKGFGLMEGWSAELRLPAKFYVEVETTRQGSDEKVKLEGGGNGDSFYLIDHGTKKAYEDMDPGVFGTAGNSLRAVGLAELVADSPFDNELAADSTYAGEEKVGDELCHKIDVTYAGGQGNASWYFSVEDHLPRRRVQHFDLPQGAGAIDIQVVNLQVESKIDDPRFTMKMPEGYEQVDDFAP